MYKDEKRKGRRYETCSFNRATYWKNNSCHDQFYYKDNKRIVFFAINYYRRKQIKLMSEDTER